MEKSEELLVEDESYVDGVSLKVAYQGLRED